MLDVTKQVASSGLRSARAVSMCGDLEFQGSRNTSRALLCCAPSRYWTRLGRLKWLRSQSTTWDLRLDDVWIAESVDRACGLMAVEGDKIHGTTTALVSGPEASECRRRTGRPVLPTDSRTVAPWTDAERTPYLTAVVFRDMSTHFCGHGHEV